MTPFLIQGDDNDQIFTGTPHGPTANLNVSSTQLATTEFVTNLNNQVVYDFNVNTETLTVTSGGIVQKMYIPVWGWIRPTSVYITSVASLPSPFLSVLGIKSQLRFTFQGGSSAFWNENASDLISSIKYTVGDKEHIPTTININGPNNTIDVEIETLVHKNHEYTFVFKSPSGHSMVDHPVKATILQDQIYKLVFPSSMLVVSTSGLPASYLFIKDKACGVKCTFEGGHDLHSSNYLESIDSIKYSTDGTLYTPVLLNTLNIVIQAVAKTIDFQYTATHTGTTYFRIVLRNGSGTLYETYAFTTAVFEFPALTTTTVNDPFVPVGDLLSFSSTFDGTLPAELKANVQITPHGQTAESIGNVSIVGKGMSYSMEIKHDVKHTGVISLSMGDMGNQYTWGGGVLNESNIFVYPTLTHASTLPSQKYTVGFANISRTFVFGSSMTDYVITGSFTSTNGTHTGNVAYSNGIISFPVNNSSGYAVNNFKLKHNSDDKFLDIPSSYDFSIGSLQFWTPPLNIDSLVTMTSLPSQFLLVVNKTCRLRLTFDGTDNFHSSNYATLLTSIEFSTNNGVAYTTVSLPSANISIHASNKTIDLDLNTTSADKHLFRIVLKGEDLANTSYYTTSIPSNKIFSFPSIVSTNKLAPYNTTDITVGKTISMESVFSSAIDSNISGSITIVDDGGSKPVPLTSEVENAKFLYSFVVNNDADHSATMTFTFGGVSNTYSWSASDILTAAHDIYTFPNSMSYDGTSNGYGSGIHLKQDTASTLVLSFTGGDKLHSNTYSLQVSSITYKTGASGTPVTVSPANVTINSSSPETITLANIVATADDNVDFTVSLLAPDGVQIPSPLAVTVPSSAVKGETWDDGLSLKYALGPGRAFSPWWVDNGQYSFNTLKFEINIPTNELTVFLLGDLVTNRDPLVTITSAKVKWMCDNGSQTIDASHGGSTGQKIIVIIVTYAGFSNDDAVIYTKIENGTWKEHWGKTGWWRGVSRGGVIVSNATSLEWYRSTKTNDDRAMLKVFVEQLKNIA